MLEEVACHHGITMSWIVRSLIYMWRSENPGVQVFHRPRNFNEGHTSFSLKLYGNKSELLNYARCNGGEFSSFVRFLLELWYNGVLEPDFENIRTIKNVKFSHLKFNGVASVKQYDSKWFHLKEFWPKNPSGNIFLMNLGLKQRKYALV